MNLKSDNIEIIINDMVDKVIEEHFQSLLFRYQIGLGTTMKGCCFISYNRGGSHIDSPDWIKETTINPINESHNKCFQYTATLALNHGKIRKYSERIAKIKSFIGKYN